MATNSRSRSLEMPTADMDLAEWANKIKAIQRQVDAEEEAEQKRLEEEIAASRFARPQHSQGPDRMGGSEWAKRAENQTQSRTLTASSRHNPEQPTNTANPAPRYGQQIRSEPMSLAVFMGGRATGPRLNKPAPQQDISDRTQFDQYARSDAPHPVFGRGGVAMPGLSRPRAPSLTRSQTVSPPSSNNDLASSDIPQARVRKMSTPSVARRYLETLESKADTGKQERPPNKPTTPTPSNPVIPIRSSTTTIPSPAEQQQAFRPGGPSTPPLPRPTDANRHDSSSPARLRSSQEGSMATPPRSAVSLPGLARPIVPDPKPTVHGPQLPSSNPSQAFLRSSPQKDPTPSLSRLQGRGFVQSMSSKLENPSSSSASQSQSERTRATSGKRTSTVLDRWQPVIASPSPSSPLSSIASRDPIQLPTPTPSPSRSLNNRTPLLEKKPQLPPSISPSPASLTTPNKAAPQPPTKPKVDAPPVSLPGLGAHALPPQSSSVVTPFEARSQPKNPPLSKNPIMARTYQNNTSSTTLEKSPTKLGSATTMVVITSPVDTGHVLDSIDDFGIRSKPSPKEIPQRQATTAFPPVSQPLAHPTKSRAKKPRKDKNTFPGKHDNESPSSTLGEPTVLRQAPTSSTFRESSDVHSLDRRMDAPRGEQEIALPRPAPPTSATKPTARPLPQPKQSVPLPTMTQNNYSVPVSSEKSTPPSPTKHSRIPSTGSRPTVMDVAQVFNTASPTSQSPPPPPPTVRAEQPPPSPQPPIAPSFLERRKSNYGKYSSIIMPPLKEENTPDPSPANSLQRPGETKVPLAEIFGSKPIARPKDDRLVHLDHVDSPLPTINIMSLLNHRISVASPEFESRTISVEILKLDGHSAAPVNDDHIFYDTEVLAIIHRAKSQSSGLVATDIWGWQGKRSAYTAQEEDKLTELAKRYNTLATTVIQHQEPASLLRVLDSKLIIRQGTRHHWSSENTTLHVVRCINGMTFIDEIDLTTRNLCSGFTYCLTLLGAIYVWHGRGATDAERQGATEYAQLLIGDGAITEMVEGENDDDEMFWMVLGDEASTQADHWKWRRSAAMRGEVIDPRIWRVDIKQGKDGVTLVASVWHSLSPHREVFIIDCMWEFYVLVGADARQKRGDIQLAVKVATELSFLVEDDRPFTPPVHVVILPSQLPLDLRMTIRDLDEAMLNGNSIPDHMNIWPSTQAVEQLQQRVWLREELDDHSMLPLGVSPAQLA